MSRGRPVYRTGQTGGIFPGRTKDPGAPTRLWRKKGLHVPGEADIIGDRTNGRGPIRGPAGDGMQRGWGQDERIERKAEPQGTGRERTGLPQDRPRGPAAEGSAAQRSPLRRDRRRVPARRGGVRGLELRYHRPFGHSGHGGRHEIQRGAGGALLPQRLSELRQQRVYLFHGDRHVQVSGRPDPGRVRRLAPGRGRGHHLAGILPGPGPGPDRVHPEGVGGGGGGRVPGSGQRPDGSGGEHGLHGERGPFRRDGPGTVSQADLRERHDGEGLSGRGRADAPVRRVRDGP